MESQGSLDSGIRQGNLRCLTTSYAIAEQNDNIVFCMLSFNVKKHGIYIHNLHKLRSTILGDTLGAFIVLSLVNLYPIDYSISPNHLGFFPSIGSSKLNEINFLLRDVV